MANMNRPAAMLNIAAGRFMSFTDVSGVPRSRLLSVAPESADEGQRGQVGRMTRLAVLLRTPANDAYQATKAVTRPR